MKTARVLLSTILFVFASHASALSSMCWWGDWPYGNAPPYTQRLTVVIGPVEALMGSTLMPNGTFTNYNFTKIFGPTNDAFLLEEGVWDLGWRHVPSTDLWDANWQPQYGFHINLGGILFKWINVAEDNCNDEDGEFSLVTKFPP